ncbi:MAG: hypothetical protein ACKV1O_11760 [Saprospiraceae bacterium]
MVTVTKLLEISQTWQKKGERQNLRLLKSMISYLLFQLPPRKTRFLPLYGD